MTPLQLGQWGIAFGTLGVGLMICAAGLALFGVILWMFGEGVIGDVWAAWKRRKKRKEQSP